MKTLAVISGFLQRRKVLLHPVRTFRFVRHLLTDKRIDWWRKALFAISIAGLALLLIFPTLLEEGVLSTILPIIGTVIGIPIGVGFDWIAFALASVHLFSLFPAELVKEHYERHIEQTPDK